VISPIPIVDQSFSLDDPPAEGNVIAHSFAGSFSSATMASGTFSLVAPVFSIDGDVVGSQICTMDVTWTAMWNSVSTPGEEITPNPANVNITIPWNR